MNIIYIIIYISVQFKVQGLEQGPKPHPFHTPVPYPRSIPPFHTPVPYPRSIPVWRIRSIPLLHTSDPYIVIYIYHYDHYYIYFRNIFEHVQSDFTFVRAHMSAHTWVHTCKNTFTMPKPCDCVGKVCACSTYSCYLLCCVMAGMCLAAASWQSKNGLLVTSQPVAGLRLHHLQLLPAVAQLWCLMVEMRLAAASW